MQTVIINNINLKPCPKCGNKPRMRVMLGVAGLSLVECTKCKVTTMPFVIRYKNLTIHPIIAAAAWNAGKVG